jgi:thioredoxin reductase (NADPH)
MTTNTNNATHTDIIVIGSGPAGFTAALYASRASLGVIVFEGIQPGGQLTITTEVENYPGFEHGIMGPELMDVFRKQSHRFGALSKYETITKVDLSSRPFRVWNERDMEYTADAIIIATGASAKLLGVKGESEYMGFGVSACATCDGFFFRDQHVYVIGGGDTAMEEANYLTKFASKVTLIHRREEFRASRIMLERVQKNPKVEFLLNTVVEEYIGTSQNGAKRLTHLRLKNVLTGESTTVDADGAFVAIGHQPNTSLFTGVLDMDETGYIQTIGKSTVTNVEGSVYRQAVTAAGSGCMAAIDAERWLAHEKHKAEA